LLLTASVHPKIVKERLGHTSIAMTLDLDGYGAMDMQRDSTGVLDRPFAGELRPKHGDGAR
jgi:hypothetical protein